MQRFLIGGDAAIDSSVACVWLILSSGRCDQV
jgi:hypothetical protein